jgi:hypothetical protein
VSKKLFKATVGDRRIHEDKISDHITAYSNGHAAWRIAGTYQQSSLKAGWNHRQAAGRLVPLTQRKNVSSLNPIDFGKP